MSEIHIHNGWLMGLINAINVNIVELHLLGKMNTNTMSKLSWKKKSLFTGIILFFSLCIALVLGECFVRLFSEHGYITPGIRKEQSLEFEAALLSKLVLKQKAKTVPLWGGKQCHINSMGYRGNEFEADKPASTYRVMIFGGSQVFDMAADIDGDWPHLTELRLHEKGYQHVEIINAGIPGLTAMDSVGRLLGEGHLYQPDCVILCNAWNDIKHFNKTESWLRHYTPHIYYKDFRIDYMNNWDQSMCEFSQLYVRLRSRYFHYSLNVGLEGAVPEQKNVSHQITANALAQYRLAIAAFVDTARNINATPILMTQARLVAMSNTPEEREKIYYEYQPYDHNTLVKAFEKTDEIIKDTAIQKDVLLIDASTFMTGRDEFFQDHVHTTTAGSQQLAVLTAKMLESIINEK